MEVDGGAHRQADHGGRAGSLGRPLEALGRWQTKTFKRRTDADAFRRSIEADELRGMVVDVRRSSAPFGEFAKAWLATRRRPDGRPLTPRTRAL